VHKLPVLQNAERFTVGYDFQFAQIRGYRSTVPGALADRLRFSDVVASGAAVFTARHVFFAGFGFRFMHSRLRG